MDILFSHKCLGLGEFSHYFALWKTKFLQYHFFKAVGSEGETLPDHVGMPLGEKYGGADYFMLETHYDNPDVHQNIIDASGLQIYYTKNLREHDTAMLLLGSEVNFLHMIPPQQEMYKTIGRCTAECTQNVRVSFTVFSKKEKLIGVLLFNRVFPTTEFKF